MRCLGDWVLDLACRFQQLYPSPFPLFVVVLRLTRILPLPSCRIQQLDSRIGPQGEARRGIGVFVGPTIRGSMTPATVWPRLRSPVPTMTTSGLGLAIRVSVAFSLSLFTACYLSFSTVLIVLSRSLVLSLVLSCSLISERACAAPKRNVT